MNRDLMQALELAENRVAMWEEYADTLTLSLSEFYECGGDEARAVAANCRAALMKAQDLLKSDPLMPEHFGQRYAHPKVMDEAMIHNAMDIWEVVIMSIEFNNGDDLYQWFTQQDGRNEGVEIAMTMAPRFEEAWNLVKDDMDGRPFDFEFVPPLIDKLFCHGEAMDLPVYEIEQDTINRLALEIVDELPEVE